MSEFTSFLLLAYFVIVLISSQAKKTENQKNYIVRNIILQLIFAGVWFYRFYPALNFHSTAFWLFFLIITFTNILLFYKNSSNIELPQGKGKFKLKKENFTSSGKLTAISLILIILAAYIGIYFICRGIFSPVLRAKAYAERIHVTTVDFDEIPPYRFNETAIIDRASSQILGDKVMGQMTDLVSQFSVSNEYSQISYKEGTYRVTPLAYDGFIKYIRNRSEGIPGYIIVNTTTGETQLVRLSQKMRYVPSAYFNENLYRKLRFQYPTQIFDDPTFEIDEEGNPWYVCTTYTYDGIDSRRRVTGAILFNPIDGTSTRYDVKDVPTWVDRIYPESLITEELNDYGKYQKGWLNSMIGQEGVIQTSEGYNYISKNGDVWLYTGMTSVVSDNSNIGFMLVNLRTHEAQFIPTSGADEYSIMASAEGEVLNYGYTATFPVLVNINDKPVYLLSLKDSAGLIKMYALVDAQDYQQVYTIKAERNAKVAIESLIAEFSGGKSVNVDSLQSKTITIDQIQTVVIEGNTTIFIKSNNDIYKLVLTEDTSPKAIFLKEKDTITVHYIELDDVYLIQSID